MSEEKLPDGYENYPVKCQEFTLYDSHVEFKLPNGTVRAITVGDFIGTLSRTLQQENHVKSTLLPANCYVIGQSVSEMQLSCYYPGRKRIVQFYRKHGDRTTVSYTIPFPNVIISHRMRKAGDGWEHQESRYWATSKTIGQLGNEVIWNRDELNQIWALPLANIYPDGKLCQGDNTLPKIFTDPHNLRGLDWHFAVLYNSSFNEDLHLPSVAKARRAEVWYQELSEKDTFPYNLLKHGDKVQTISTVSTAQEVMADAGNTQTVTVTAAPETPTAPLPPIREQVTAANLDALMNEVIRAEAQQAAQPTAREAIQEIIDATQRERI